MPVYRFRSFEEARRALWRYEPDEAYYRMLSDLFELGNRLAQSAKPAGIFRFHSISEKNAEEAIAVTSHTVQYQSRSSKDS